MTVRPGPGPVSANQPTGYGTIESASPWRINSGGAAAGGGKWAYSQLLGVRNDERAKTPPTVAGARSAVCRAMAPPIEKPPRKIWAGAARRRGSARSPAARPRPAPRRGAGPMPLAISADTRAPICSLMATMDGSASGAISSRRRRSNQTGDGRPPDKVYGCMGASGNTTLVLGGTKAGMRPRTHCRHARPRSPEPCRKKTVDVCGPTAPPR